MHPASELVRRADQQRWADVRPHLAAMEVVVDALRGRTDGAVLVVGGRDAAPWAAILADQWPSLRVSTVQLPDDASTTHARLTVEGPFDLVVDASDETGNEQALLFERVFMHLRRGGEYVARRLVPQVGPSAATTDSQAQGRASDAVTDGAATLEVADPPNENPTPGPPYAGDLWTLLSAAQSARTRDFTNIESETGVYPDAEGVGRCLERLQVSSKVLRVVNGARVASLVREEELSVVLEGRPELGAVLESRPAVTWDAAFHYSVNRSDDPFVRRRYAVPELSLRRYDSPVCSRGQLVTRDDVIFPDSFRQSWMSRFSNVYMVDAAPRFGRVRRDLSDPDELPGAWFHLDCEWPGQFGHLMTEQLGRMWAWEAAKRREPELKVLLTLEPERDPAVLADFEIDILGAFGVRPEDVHIFQKPCRPERLYSATSMFALSRYVHPDMGRLWTQIGDAVVRDAPRARRPRRIFVSRSKTLKRSCHNVEVVEQIFASRGFHVFRPEEHPLSEQVALFRSADVVAGLAGSALFSLGFCTTGKRVILLAPDAYTARNEHLISAVRGHDLTAVHSRSDVEHPPGGWSWEAFATSFTFDVDDEGRYLEKVLDGLDR
ncbi:DUF563 domain-containing protein [Terracoccus sp. 273MFTsu3.1]|uniref:glycosyltransferase family 61 protein n=1 Tax=Terracoccus sp. 273MFTsu3.1 TaxID=1172188 RepID=UPI0003733DC1|nr:glycosyltransferase family 61 protein [Terracoccus sp. 273MFTsu3.1]